VSKPSSVCAALTISVGLIGPGAWSSDPDPSSRQTRPEDLVYSVERTPELASDTARAVTVITIEDIWRKNGRTLPEVLMEEAGVFVQQTNYGSGSPIIRGLVGKEILILIDGVKVNNAIYRTGPTQYLNTIDLSMVERIEIVRGVVSVLGGDALGGTINIITRKGEAGADAKQIRGRVSGRYSSADGALGGRAEARGRLDRLRYLVGATYRSSDDVRGGGDVGTQQATGYDEQAGNALLEYSIAQDRTLSFSYVVLDEQHVPRTDRVTAGTNLKFDFHPQRLQLASLAYQDLALGRIYDSLKLTAFWNRQDEGRQEVRPNRPREERQFDDRDTMYGVNLELSQSFGNSHRLLYGADFSTEDILSRRNDVNLDTHAISPKRGNFTDGASYDSLAVYVQDHAEPVKWLTVIAGARYNYYSVKGSEKSTVGTLALDTSDSHLTGTINAIAHAGHGLNVVLNATSGYRALNIEDISVFDERTEGTEIPNAGLKPERIAMYEAGLKYSSAKVTGLAFVYRSQLSDVLVRAAGTYAGLAFFDLNASGVQDKGEANVLQRQNIGEATIQGVELEARYRPWPELTLFGNYTTTKGDDELSDVPLARIPPAYGTLGARWLSSRRFKPWVELVLQLASAQRRLNPNDISDTRIGPKGTDGFTVLTLRGGCAISERLRAVIAGENLADEKYKYHGSGVYRPGRQIVVGVEAGF
jgi:hemoglobin/transferrin/lactoferrin receptor protein